MSKLIMTHSGNPNPTVDIIRLLSEERKAEQSGKYKTDTLKNFIRYYSGEFDQWWDRSLITDEQLKLQSVTDYLCTYCSYKFDVWYNKDSFNIKSYDSLAKYCRYKFDIWFDKNKLKKYLSLQEKNGLAFLEYFKYQDKFETIFMSDFLPRTTHIKYLYEQYENKKSFWLNKNNIDFSLRCICESLVQNCGKDIDIWFNKDKFIYTPETCYLFCHEFSHADHRRKFIDTFKLWWNPDKFDFTKIVKVDGAINSWNNMYSGYKNEWQKHVICEKLKE